MVSRCITSAALVVLFLMAATAASAQTSDSPEKTPFLVDLAKDIVFDPTTWAPASISYAATQLDWNSSQVFFRNGIMERNARFTVSATSPGVAIGYAEGNRQILKDTLATLQMSVANNVTANLVERVLIKRFPERRKLLRTLGCIERIGVASYWSHRLSAAHFQQWQTNQRLARQYGYK